MIQEVQTLSGNVNGVQTLSGSAKETGIQGLSAYEVYKKNGGTLSETEWLESLKGKDGENGKDGYTPIKGVDYFDGEKGEPGEKGEKGETGGVSLEEVTAITGNTDELETESKQLVGAINEVLNNSGGGSYTAGTNISITDNVINCDISFEETQYRGIRLGSNTTTKNQSIVIGGSASTTNTNTVVIGDGAKSSVNGGIAIGKNANSNKTGSIAIGFGSLTTENNQIMIGSSVSKINKATIYTLNGAKNLATEEYVNTAITNAITTTLEGSY